MPFFGIPIRNGLPIGLGSVAGFGVAPEFSPADLFLGGVNGAWYDPSDSTTLFSDTAGTTPVAQPGAGAQVVVGAMLDERAPSYSNYFDGTGDFLSTAVSSAFAFGTGDFTLSAFIYPTTTTGVQIIIDCRAATVGDPGPVIYLNGTTLSSAKNQSTVINSGGTVTANQWSFVELTRTSGSWRLFLNGSLVAGPTTDTINYTDNSAAYIAQNAAAATQYFTGYIASVRILKGVGGTTSVVPTSPLTAITGTSLLTCGTSWSGNPAITVSGNTRVDGLNPFVASPVGNHAISYNSTTARPELSARVNLLERSEQFDNAYWTKGDAVITPNATIAPDGTLTADKLNENTNNAAHFVERLVGSLTGIYKASIYAKAGERTWMHVNLYPFANGRAWFDLANGVLGTVDAGVTATITAVGNGWYLCTATRNTGASTYVDWYTATGDGVITYTGTNGYGIYIWGADLRPTNIGSAVPAYQRIADQYTYDNSASFPRYLRFDGVDDGMSTPANLNLTSTDKATVFAGVRKLSDAAIAILAELSASTSNSGVFSACAPITAGAGSYRFLSRGNVSTADAIVSSGYAAPITNVFTGIGDISGDLQILRLNGIQAASSTADQGTGNFGTYPLYIGARNNASLWFNGQLYSLIVRGAATDASTISATETWVANETGISIFDNGPSLGLDFTAQTYQVWEV